MKAEVAKSFLIKRLIKNGSILLVLAIITGLCYYFNSNNIANIEATQSEITMLSGQMIERNNLYDDAQANFKKFTKIPQKSLPTKNGFGAGYMRVKELMPKFNKLKDTYKFKTLNLDIEEIKPSQSIVAQDFEAFEGVLSINFEGATDEFVVSFINDLSFMLPGYLDLQKINFFKNKDITNETITEYLAVKDFYFVGGIIKLNWITFKSKVNQ